MFKRTKYWLLKKLLGELCVKSGGCRSCKARMGSMDISDYRCTHGRIFEQAIDVWGCSKSYNPLPKEE